MFINVDDNLFFIFIINLVEWIVEIEDNDIEYNFEIYEMLGNFWNLFEFVSDNII